MNNWALRMDGIGKSYPTENGELWVLKDIQCEIQAGSITSIVGPSGSGKTTLLGLSAGLDNPSKGRVEILDSSWQDMNEDQRAKFRSQHIGFVFQNFELIPTLTALENVEIPLHLLGQKNATQRAKDLLTQVGLAQRLNHYPTQLSGGEQQRVAIARAFANSPKILFADEPTGNLDEDSGDNIEQLLFNLNREFGTTMVLVTHNLQLANRTDRIIRLKGGKLIADEQPVTQAQ
ncbi:ABC transporter ATP-binding protein [bacterium SCSIO 12741]|nr:ABC transporter ATP-binding protein [bacterium SCSIO 12741]